MMCKSVMLPDYPAVGVPLERLLVLGGILEWT